MNECGWLLMNPSLAGERCDEKKRTEKRREKREKIPILGRGRDTTMLARHVQLRKMSFSIDHWMTSEWRIDCEWMGMKGKMYEWFNYILVTTSASKNLCKSKNTRITLTSPKTNLILGGRDLTSCSNPYRPCLASPGPLRCLLVSFVLKNY